MKDICIKLGVDAYTLIKQSAQAYARHAMSLHAAALAYRVLFSVFPFIVFLVSLLSFFALPAFFGWIREQALPFLPHAALAQVDAIIRELQVPRMGLLSASSAVSLWMASSGMRQLMIALNVVYEAEESRPVWKRIPFSILSTIGFAMMLGMAGTMMHFGPPAMRWLAHVAGLEATFIVFWEWLRWPAALLLSNFAVAFAYYVVPNVKHRFRLFSAGSLLSVIVWSAAAVAFRYYLQNFSHYDLMFGSIGAIMVLLVYVRLSITVLLFGAEVNAVIEQRRHARPDRAAHAQPSTSSVS